MRQEQLQLLVLSLMGLATMAVAGVVQSYDDHRPRIYMAQDVFLKINTIKGSNEF